MVSTYAKIGITSKYYNILSKFPILMLCITSWPYNEKSIDIYNFRHNVFVFQDMSEVTHN